MSGVVHLPPRSKQQRIRFALVRLRSVLTHWVPRLKAPDSHAPDRELGGVHPITPSAASTALFRSAGGTLGVSSRRAHEQHIIQLRGALSGRTRDPLTDALEDALEDGSKLIVLDLRGLHSIDMAGLDTILTAHLRAGDELKCLVIVPGSPQIQRVLDASQGPFLYTSEPRKPAVAGARARRRRARFSPRDDRATTHPGRARRSR